MEYQRSLKLNIQIMVFSALLILAVSLYLHQVLQSVALSYELRELEKTLLEVRATQELLIIKESQEASLGELSRRAKDAQYLSQGQTHYLSLPASFLAGIVSHPVP